MNKIKYIKLNFLIIILFLFSTFIVANSISSENELIINEIKKSYEDKVDLTDEQLEKINKKTKNKDYLNSDEKFMLGYINLFVDNNKSLAYEYFEQVIKSKNKVKSDFSKVYSYKFLAQKYIEEDNEEKGIEYTKHALYSINPRNHGEYRNLINDIFRPVMQLKESRSMIIDFFEYMLLENYKHPDIQAEFYAHRTLEQLYFLTGSYHQAAENSIKVVEIGLELEKQYFVGKSLVNLARIAHMQGDSNKALKIIDGVKKIKAEDAEWNDKLNAYRLLILYQIKESFGELDKALEYAHELDNYKDNLTYEDKLDVDIMQSIILSNIYIAKDELELAKVYLNEAGYMLDIDKVAYWQDKDIYYYMTYGRLSEKMGNYDYAKESYIKAKNLSVERDNLEGIIGGLSSLERIYSKLQNEEISKEYNLQLFEARQNEKKSIYQDYMNYKNKESRILEVENKIKITYILNILLIITVIVITISLYKIKIYPSLKLKKLRKKVEQYVYNNNYLLYYQPIINPKKNEIIGLEALIRLNDKGKIVFPDVIIKEIEESNMMEKVSIWILNKIIEDYNIIKLNKNIINKFYISMNISLKEIENDYFIDEVIENIIKSGISKNSICIEITENKGADNMDKASTNILKLKDAGVIIAIDDFGVEYSNLSMLDKIEYDIVKLDKVFIDNIDKSKTNKNIIKACDYISIENDKSIVMEGVESIEQVEFIKNMKSEKFNIQGYFYSKPIEIEKLLKYDLSK